MKKERVYTFKHFKQFFQLDDGIITKEEFEKNFIKELLTNGYYPINIKSEILDNYCGQRVFYGTCVCCYAGKKTAKTMWDNNPYYQHETTYKLK